MAGIPVDRFWDLTPYEINLQILGYQKHMHMMQEIFGWHASVCVSPWSKRGTKMSKLVKPYKDPL